MQMRIHKFLAHAGVASRRHAEGMVMGRRIMINGELAKIGQVIDSEKDIVTVNGKPVKLVEEKLYYLVHKPRGYISTATDPEGRRTVLDLVPDGRRLYPVGRLDYASEGLILLTNDGELAQKMTHPKFEVDKIYHVLVKGKPSVSAIGRLEKGVYLSDGITAPAKVAIGDTEHDNTWLDITIHEGRNRQVRRMFEVIEYPVIRLIRIALGPWQLGDLPVGKFQKVAI